MEALPFIFIPDNFPFDYKIGLGGFKATLGIRYYF